MNPTYFSDHFPTYVIIYPEASQILGSWSLSDNQSTGNKITPKSSVDHLDANESYKIMGVDAAENEGAKNIKQKQIRVIERLDSKSSNGLISYVESQGYHVINSNNNKQKGHSCGYICACIAMTFYNLHGSPISNWINHDSLISTEPDIILYNQILGLDGNKAQFLDSVQIHSLVSTLTGDKNLPWFFTVDVNLFKAMVKTSFSNVSLPRSNGKKWAVFAVNDAILDDKKRQMALRTNSCHGSHWFTALVIID